MSERKTSERKEVSRNEAYKYEVISVAETFELLQLLEEEFQQFILSSNYPPHLEYFVSRRDLIDMIVRVDKKEAHFRFYHDMEISERKRVALYAYWILKFKPFKITDIRCIDEPSENINEAFAIYLICSILFYSKTLYSTIVKEDKFYQKVLYDFRYREISMDSMMLFTDTICAQSFDMPYDELDLKL